MARIEALTAENELVQTFKNCLAEPMEAVYILPVPDRVAVELRTLAQPAATVNPPRVYRWQFWKR